MKKLYIDATQLNAGIGIIANDAEVIYTGATVYSVPVGNKSDRAKYAEFANEYDLKFILDDDTLEIDFYTVPKIDIFATDSRGGLFAAVGCVDDDSFVCYIDKDRKCYDAADNFKELITKVKEGRFQKSDASLTDRITFFKSREDAAKHIDFFDLPTLPESSDGPTAYFITLDDDCKS